MRHTSVKFQSREESEFVTLESEIFDSQHPGHGACAGVECMTRRVVACLQRGHFSSSSPVMAARANNLRQPPHLISSIRIESDKMILPTSGRRDWPVAAGSVDAKCLSRLGVL